jgi:two-component system response regulator DevR
MAIRVFVLDDHELVRTGLRALLEAEDGMEVVGEAGTAEDGVRLIRELVPDVAILDVRLPDGNGIEVCREIQSNLPEVRCLMLTSYSDDDALFSSIMAGASGYVLKEVGGGDLLGDIRRVAEGMSLLDPALTHELFDRLRKDQEAESRLTVLTPQERKVLELIAQGQSNRQIAEQLFLAEATVKNYVSSLGCGAGPRRRCTRRCWPNGSRRAPARKRRPTPIPDSGHAHPAVVVERAEVDARPVQQPLQPLPLGQRVHEAGGIALNPHGGAQPEQHPVVVQLQRQVLGHDVRVVQPVVAVQPPPALQEDDDQLLPGGRQLNRVHLGAEATQQLAVHRHCP